MQNYLRMPRSKAYKLDVRYESQSSHISLAPDLAICQLKQEIFSQFKIPVEEQALTCNGKHLDPETDNLTIKQAKIANNSKILVHRVPLPSQDKIKEQPIVDETFKELEKLVMNASEVIKSVHTLEKERRRLQSGEDSLAKADHTADYKRLKLECGKNGEQLIRILESLDQIFFTEEQVEQRSRRKQVATKLNYVLDQNDKILQKLTQAIENGC